MRSFLKIPLKIHHALLLVTELALKSNAGGVVTLQEITETTGISQGFLEQVAGSLRRAGLIVGQRGAGGGYRLAADPAKLTVADVLAAFTGPIAVIDCLGDRQTCALAGTCANRGVWAEINRQIVSTLNRMTIAEAAGLKPTRRRKSRP